MTQLDYIVHEMKNLRGKAIYSQLYEEYEKVSVINLTSGRKTGIRKNIEDHSSESMNYNSKKAYFIQLMD